MKLIIMGPPGSGKGTHAKRLAAKLGILHISTGDLFRQIAKEDSEKGRRTRDLLNSGALFPDDFMLQILMIRLDKPDAGNEFILDGFPRTANQAKLLDERTRIDKAIYLKVSDVECLRRLAERKICSGCGAIYGNENPPKREGKCDACGGELHVREDDREEAIMKRLRLYHEQTEPILDFYRDRRLLIEVEVRGIRQPEQVFKDVCDALGIE